MTIQLWDKCIFGFSKKKKVYFLKYCTKYQVVKLLACFLGHHIALASQMCIKVSLDVNLFICFFIPNFWSLNVAVELLYTKHREINCN